MKTVSIGRLGAARLWVDETAGAAYDSSGVAIRSARPGSHVPSRASVTIEAVVPRGARSEYGLLGVTVALVSPGDGTRLEVPWAESANGPWTSPLVGITESAHSGLPKEYAEAVLEGLASGTNDRLAPSVVRVSEAAHGLVGSSPDFMSRLARAVTDVLVSEVGSEKALEALLERALA